MRRNLRWRRMAGAVLWDRIHNETAADIFDFFRSKAGT